MRLGERAATLAIDFVGSSVFVTSSGLQDLADAMITEGANPDTRPFLRPVYKVCKHLLASRGASSSSSSSSSAFSSPVDETDDDAVRRWAKQNNNFIRALAIAEWVVLLSREGDHYRKIPRQPQLQPAYILNTIITMCQRASASREARAAYSRMVFHGLEPSVFTMTALLDTLGRAHDAPAAHWLFKQMSAKHCLVPNGNESLISTYFILRLTLNATPPSHFFPQLPQW